MNPVLESLPVERVATRGHVTAVRVIAVRVVGLACITIAITSMAVWTPSFFTRSIGIFSLGQGTSIRISGGVAELDHVYEYDAAPPVRESTWHTTAMARGWRVPSYPMVPFVPWFSFSRGVKGIAQIQSDGEPLVSPARYWLLRVPLWFTMLPGVAFAIAWTVACSRRRSPEPRGFAVTLGQIHTE